MPFAKGTKLGRYEVVSLLGVGGMGEVYVARDPKIGREVAVKVLLADVSGDKERLLRFEQEAQAAGALNHPNILAIYDVDAEGEIVFVVSELLNGENLRDHMGNSPMPVTRAIEYALQTAKGLAAAHEKGIIHRDIKPENIFITSDGRVKILDFGLAKLSEPNGSAAGTDLPTRKINTSAGAVMGTVGYMSPEQLRGNPVDPRTDIFSFGTVLYEMLSGKKAFQRDSTADTISAILRENPPELSQTNELVDQGLERVVHRCLEKQREQRFHSASDLAFALDSLSGGSGSSQITRVLDSSKAETGSRSQLVSLGGWAAAGLLLMALVGGWWWMSRDTVNPAAAMRFSIYAPPKITLGDSVVISPDGTQVAFTAAVESGGVAMFVRPINGLEAKQLLGTEGAAYPFWSPDSRYIAFFAGNKLKKIEVGGGPSQSLATVSNDTRGGAWGSDGTILFTPDTSSPLHKVSASGGEALPITKLNGDKGETSHRWPSFLPDGRHFLYFGRGINKEEEGIFFASLDSTDVKYVIRTETRAEYASLGPGSSQGMLLFLRERSLMAQPFDAASGTLSGEAVAIAQDVLGFPTEVGPTAQAAFSASSNGHLVYRTGGTQATQLTWFDRSGKEQEKISPPAIHHEPQISRDGKKVLFGREEAGASDIVLADTLRGSVTRLTFGTGTEASPVLSPDNTRFAFAVSRPDQFAVHQKLASGAGADELVAEFEGDAFPDSWSPDGKHLLVEVNNGSKTKFDIMAVSLTGTGHFPYIATEFEETHSQFSPDGRFAAYVSNESGRPEVYVQNFPATGGKWQISTGGGDQPQWRADGKELYYLAADRNLMAVPIVNLTTFEAGRPQALFLTNMPITGSTDDKNSYAPSTDGNRFLLCDLVDDNNLQPLTLVLNWASELKK